MSKKGIFTLNELKKAGLKGLNEKKGIWTREEVEKFVGGEFDDDELLGKEPGDSGEVEVKVIVEESVEKEAEI